MEDCLSALPLLLCQSTCYSSKVCCLFSFQYFLLILDVPNFTIFLFTVDLPFFFLILFSPQSVLKNFYCGKIHVKCAFLGGRAARHAGSQFPDHWKPGVLTTGPRGGAEVEVPKCIFDIQSHVFNKQKFSNVTSENTAPLTFPLCVQSLSNAPPWF